MTSEQGDLFREPSGATEPRVAAKPVKIKKEAVPPFFVPETAPDLGTLAQVESHFGVSLRKHQAETLESMVRGESTILTAPTSAGKSLCFQAASMLLKDEGVGVVVYPLRALVQDQVRRCRELGIPFVAFYGEVSRKLRPFLIDLIRRREVVLVLTTPESLARNESLRAALRHAGVSFTAVDEAHAYEESSFAFRADYRKVGPISREIGARRILLCSGTFTHYGIIEAAKVFKRIDWSIVTAPATRPNLGYCDLETSPAEFVRNELSRGDQSGIVYFSAVKKLDQCYEELGGSRSDALTYNGQMSKKVRRENLETWLAGQRCMLATKAMGMGIDKRDVRYVVHAQLPTSILDYAQEAGRAGRDGKPAMCYLTQEDDGRTANYLVELTFPYDGVVKSVFDWLVSQSDDHADAGGWFDLEAKKCAQELGLSRDDDTRAVYSSARWLADSRIVRTILPESDWKFFIPPDADSRADRAGHNSRDVLDRIRDCGEEDEGELIVSKDEVEEAVGHGYEDWRGKIKRMAEAGIFTSSPPKREKTRVSILSNDFSRFDAARLSEARSRVLHRVGRMRELQRIPWQERRAMIESEVSTDFDALREGFEKLRREGIGAEAPMESENQ